MQPGRDEENSRKRKKKQWRRGTVSRATISAVSVDLWLIILGRAYPFPHLVFRLMMTCRTLRDALRHSAQPAWWEAFFRRVCAYQAALHHSNFEQCLLAYERRGTFSPEGILRAVFAPRCDACGARRGHRLLRPFAVRVCAACLRTHAVSNQALEVYCGLRFCDFVVPYAASGGVLLSLDAFAARGAALLRLSSSPCDARHVEEGRRPDGRRVHRVRKGTFFFLWRPDVERLLGGSLLPLAQAQLLRRHAAARLSACVQRLGERLWALAALRMRASGGGGGGGAEEEKAEEEEWPLPRRVQLKLRAVAAQTCAALRDEQRLQPAPQWFPGGLYHSVSGSPLYPPSEAVRLRQVLLRARALPLGAHWFPREAPGRR